MSDRYHYDEYEYTSTRTSMLYLLVRTNENTFFSGRKAPSCPTCRCRRRRRRPTTPSLSLHSWWSANNYQIVNKQCSISSSSRSGNSNQEPARSTTEAEIPGVRKWRFRFFFVYGVYIVFTLGTRVKTFLKCRGLCICVCQCVCVVFTIRKTVPMFRSRYQYQVRPVPSNTCTKYYVRYIYIRSI